MHTKDRSALCIHVGEGNSGLVETLTGHGGKGCCACALLLFSYCREDLASLALLFRKQEPCLRKEALPSHSLIAACDSQMNNINSSTKGRIQQQIESSSCITEGIIMGTASMKEGLYVGRDRLQDIYKLRENSERESRSQQLQEKYKGTQTCRERKKTECPAR